MNLTDLTHINYVISLFLVLVSLLNEMTARRKKKEAYKNLFIAREKNEKAGEILREARERQENAERIMRMNKANSVDTQHYMKKDGKGYYPPKT